ncbi:MAG: hypothetical protein C0506_05225 [Anaerolinea sp.]|nr:hypothetical protein [Anaerolinea sp.]
MVAPVGEQLPVVPPPPNEPMHWLTVAAVIAAGLPVKLLVTTTEHFTTPPPPLPEPLHCWTSVTGSADVVGVVVHVPPPAAIGPAAPVQTFTVTVDSVPVGAPAAVT